MFDGRCYVKDHKTNQKVMSGWVKGDLYHIEFSLGKKNVAPLTTNWQLKMGKLFHQRFGHMIGKYVESFKKSTPEKWSGIEDHFVMDRFPTDVIECQIHSKCMQAACCISFALCLHLL
jgi:hypothetical protein